MTRTLAEMRNLGAAQVDLIRARTEDLARVTGSTIAEAAILQAALGAGYDVLQEEIIKRTVTDTVAMTKEILEQRAALDNTEESGPVN